MKINKKAVIGFPTLMVIFSAVAFFLIVIFLSSSFNEVSSNPENFGESTKTVDFIMARQIADNFHRENLMKNVFDKLKEDFGHNSRTGNPTICDAVPSNMYKVWYNEKIRELNTGQNPEDCIPKIGDEVLSDFKNYVEKQLSKSFIDTSEKSTEFTIEETLGVISVVVSNIYEVRDPNTYISHNNAYEIDFNIENYLKLMERISEVISEIPNTLSTKVPECVRENLNNNEIKGDIHVYCIKEKFKEELLSEELKNVYNVKVSYNDLRSSNPPSNPNKYYGLNVEIEDKQIGKSEMKFSVIYENTIPFYYVRFDLENMANIDGVINLNIEEPKFASRISNYIVLYSNQNFFSIEGNSDYEKLLELLQESRIPQVFDDTGFTDSGANRYFYSNLDSGIKLSLISVGTRDFSTRANGREVKTVQLYQLYDFDKGEYRKFKNGEEIFVYVFAVDQSYNYYTEELDENIVQSRIAKNQFGPKPLESSNVEITGNINGLQNSLKVEISGYADPSFSNYHVYIVRENSGYTLDDCMIDLCYKYDGSSLNSEDITFYIVPEQLRNSEAISSIDGNRIISQQNFEYDGTRLNKHFIENDNQYRIMVVPVDNEGNGLTETNLIRNWFVPTGNIGLFRFERLESPKRVDPHRSNSISITDRMNPPSNSILQLRFESTQEGLAIINWGENPNSLEEIINIEADLVGLDSEGFEVSRTPFTLVKGKSIQAPARLENIMLIDKAGNKGEANPNYLIITN